MRRPSLASGALLGGLLAVPLIALFFLGQQAAGLPFIPFDLFDWLARALPGGIVTMGIDTMVRVIGLLGLGPTDQVAKAAEQVIGLLIFVAGGVAVGVLVAWLVRRAGWRGWRAGLAVGTVLYLFILIVEFSLGFSGDPTLPLVWLALLMGGWTALLGFLLETAPATGGDEIRAGRRAALAQITGGSVAVALAAWGLGRLLRGQEQETGAGQPLGEVPAGPVNPMPYPTPLPTPSGRPEPVPGTRPEVTANDDFYRIDINLVPPRIDGASWALSVSGLFDRPRPLTLSDLLAYPAVTQPITLSCISNPIGGDLIGTGNWTGVRLRDVLVDLGLQAAATALFLKAADGFFESVSMRDMMDDRTLLVYGMNGETLPVAHGYPLRILIPNRYGMKQPKWITSMEAIDEERQGYWVVRRWSEQARPQIVSVIDTVAQEHAVAGTVPVGGIAWAGDRGIQKVEVQADKGTWAEATLREPPLGPLAWIQWRYEWPASSGPHTLRVRATDGRGVLQTEKVQDVRPDGATGYHSIEVVIR